MMNGKKGHFDLSTLLVSLLGGVIGYVVVEKIRMRKYENRVRVRK